MTPTSIEVQPRPDDQSNPRAALWLVLLAWASLSCGASQRPDVVLVTIDTLRADHLGAYAAGASRTPHMDRFARDATVFTRAASPMPLTLPAHFSMFTALYPREHGVLNNTTALPGSALTLAERMRANGYRTAAFVGVRLFSGGSGTAQGFEVFDIPASRPQRPARRVVVEALKWLVQLPEVDRFFLWVHLFDPHQPYDPPEPFRDDLDDDLALSMPRFDGDALMRSARQHGGDVPEAVLEHAKALYRGEIAFTDHWFGELLDGLGAARNLDKTLVILTADHGECFENGVFFDHADCLFEGATRIPLIVRYPPQFRAGDRIDAQVSIVDVAPTILAAARLAVPDHFSGRPLQDSRDLSDRYVLLQYPFYAAEETRARLDQRRRIHSVAGTPVLRPVVDAEKVGIVGRDWKYLRSEGSEELYEMSPVSDERENRIGTKLAVDEKMNAILDDELEQHPLSLPVPSQISDEAREMLQALGYVD